MYNTDTLEVHDTTTMVYVDTAVVNDTTYFWETKFQTITKTKTIRDSIKSVVVDSAQVQVLRRQLNDAVYLRDSAIKDMKGLRKMIYLICGGALMFFLLLFKLK